MGTVLNGGVNGARRHDAPPRKRGRALRLRRNSLLCPRARPDQHADRVDALSRGEEEMQHGRRAQQAYYEYRCTYRADPVPHGGELSAVTLIWKSIPDKQSGGLVPLFAEAVGIREEPFISGANIEPWIGSNARSDSGSKPMK
ncbi:hypothetical protein E4U55_005790 [Claviceps digitariae]|nr:hypothetical protein E4U55_005790 [Claviceps digitariae]